MRVELFGPLPRQGCGNGIQDGGVICRGGLIVQLGALAAGIQVAKIHAGNHAFIHTAKGQHFIQRAQLVHLAHRFRAKDTVAITGFIHGLNGAAHGVQRLFQCGFPALLAAAARVEDDPAAAQCLDQCAALQQVVHAVQPLVLLQAAHADVVRRMDRESDAFCIKRFF